MVRSGTARPHSCRRPEVIMALLSLRPEWLQHGACRNSNTVGLLCVCACVTVAAHIARCAIRVVHSPQLAEVPASPAGAHELALLDNLKPGG